MEEVFLVPQVRYQLRGCYSFATGCSAPSIIIPTTGNFQTMPDIILADNSESVSLKYQGVEHLRDVVLRQYDSLKEFETSQQILKFQPVTDEEFATLSADKTILLKSIKFHYYRPTKLLLVKVMPGWDQKFLAAVVRKMIDKQLMDMNVYDECFSMASPLTELRDWIKEPDLCWAPAANASDMTCMVEIGTSATPSRLSADAYGWLESPISPVQAVIVSSFEYLSTEIASNPITISAWK